LAVDSINEASQCPRGNRLVVLIALSLRRLSLGIRNLMVKANDGGNESWIAATTREAMLPIVLAVLIVLHSVEHNRNRLDSLFLSVGLAHEAISVQNSFTLVFHRMKTPLSLLLEQIGVEIPSWIRDASDNGFSVSFLVGTSSLTVFLIRVVPTLLLLRILHILFCLITIEYTVFVSILWYDYHADHPVVVQAYRARAWYLPMVYQSIPVLLKSTQALAAVGQVVTLVGGTLLGQLLWWVRWMTRHTSLQELHQLTLREQQYK